MAGLKKGFCHIQALEFVHGFYLLISLASRIFKSLIFLLDSLNFTLYLFFPLFVKNDLTLVVRGFELTNFFELSLLFNF